MKDVVYDILAYLAYINTLHVGTRRRYMYL